MLLGENNTPYKRKKVVMYANDNNTAVIRRQDLQFIGLNLWRGRTMGEHGKYCRLYAFFDPLDLGLDISSLTEPDRMETSEILSTYQRKFGFLSPDDVIRCMDNWVDKSEHIPNIYIKLAGLIQPEKVPGYLAAKEQYLAAKARERAERSEQQAQLDAAYCDEMNARLSAAVDTAKQTMCSSGRVDNIKISFYRSRYDRSEYSIFNYIARQTGIKIPLRVQGWISKSLVAVEFGPEGPIKLYRRGGASKTISRYLRELVDAVRSQGQGTGTARQ